MTTKPNLKLKPLTTKQIYILELTYKMRFLTAPLLAKNKKLKSRHSMYMTLEKLANRGYLIRRRDPAPFNNKGIRYGLAPKAFPVLRARGLNEQAIHSFYKNKTVLEPFVDHQITLLKLYIKLKHPKLSIASRTEQYIFEELPQPRPDLFIRCEKISKTNPSFYFLELHHDQPLYLTKKRLRSLIDHLESEWLKATYPTLLFVLANDRDAKRFQKYAEAIIEDAGMDDEISAITYSVDSLLDDTKNIHSDIL